MYAQKSFPVQAYVHLISLRKLAFEFINAFTKSPTINAGKTTVTVPL